MEPDLHSDTGAPTPSPESTLPAVDDIQRVDTEPMDSGPQYRYGTRAPRHGQEQANPFGNSGQMAFMKPPVLATWLCLAIAWLFLGSKIPFTVFLGIPFAMVALLLAAVCLSRGGVITGALVMLLGTAGSLVVYIVGLFRFLARF